jgi:hypothetical protein
MFSRADMVTSLMFVKAFLDQPSRYLEFDRFIKGVFLSFELIITNIIIPAVNHKYPEIHLWTNLEIHKSGFI